MTRLTVKRVLIELEDGECLEIEGPITLKKRQNYIFDGLKAVEKFVEWSMVWTSNHIKKT